LARAWSASILYSNPGELMLQHPTNLAEKKCENWSVNLLLKFLSEMMRKEFPENYDVVKKAVDAIIQGGLLDVLNTSKSNASFPSILKCISDFLLESYLGILDASQNIDIRWASILGTNVLSPILNCLNSSGNIRGLPSAMDDVLVAILTCCSEILHDASTETSSRSMEVALSIQEVNPRASCKLQMDVFENMSFRFPLFGFFANLYSESAYGNLNNVNNDE
jgi:hypothetical protein